MRLAGILHRRQLVAAVAGSLGLTTWWVHARLPPGLGVGDPGTLALRLFGSPTRIVVLVALALALATGASLGAGRIARRRGISPRRAAEVLSPILWGAALPSLATFLDTASFRCTADVLAWLGILLGILAASRRLRSAGDGRGEAPGPGTLTEFLHGGRAPIAVLAVLVPLALLPGWTEPAGDEPHYLLVSHSIWVDGDLDVADDYVRREYREFHPEFLWPHSRPGRGGRGRYSMHGVGIPTLLTPAYAVGRSLGGAWVHALPRALLALLYGLFAWVLYGTVEDLAGSGAARRGTAAAVLLGPLLFSPLYIFPEVPAMLLSCAAYRRLRGASETGDLLIGGTLLALLPWVGVKYVPLATALGAMMVLRPDAEAPRRRRLLAVGLPIVIATILHAGFTWRLYGSVSPLAIYLGGGETARAPAFGDRWAAYVVAWPGALRTAVGFLLDQREGLLAVGPHYLLAAAGIPWLWRRRRWDLATLAVVAAAHVGPYALSQQLGGQGPPARPLMAVLWVAAVPLGLSLVLPGRGRRLFDLLRGALLVVATAITVVLSMHPEMLPHDYPVKSSWLLRDLSPRGLELWRAFPVWLSVRELPWLVVSAWGAAVALLVVVLVRVGSRRAGLDEGRNVGAWTSWAHGAAAVAALALSTGALHLQSQAVLRDRHVGGPIGGGIDAWTIERLPERAWVEPEGLWVRPGAPRRFVLTRAEPIRSLRVRLRTLVETPVSLTLQGERLSAIIAPDEPLDVELAPGSGWPWRGGTALHLELRAARGASPAELGPGEDRRLLGVRFRILGASPATTERASAQRDRPPASR